MVGAPVGRLAVSANGTWRSGLALDLIGRISLLCPDSEMEAEETAARRSIE